MDLCRETVWDTPNDGTQYAKLEEADRVYDFLAGLNPKFDTVCGRILRQRPLPSLMEVCFEVCLKEDRTNAMGVLTTLTIDSAAFSARSSNHDNDKNNEKSILVCEHYKKQWHTKDQCWKLHGRPLGSKKRSSNEKQNSGRAYISETTPASISRSTGPTVSQTKTPTLGAIAQSGMPQFHGLISVDGKNPWILDSGATDHLTGSSEHFISYAPCAGNKKIRIADDSIAPIAGKGQIVPFNSFALQNVLHDMSSGRTIGTARHSRGLYILDDNISCSSLSRVSLLSSYFSTSEQDYKFEVSSIFQNFYHTIETQFHTKIAILRSDNGREFQNHNLSEFLAFKGIVHQTSCAYTPQQNGVAERKNRHLVEVARSLMLSISLPSYLWGDAILTAAHLINRMPSCIFHFQTPLDCLKESYPSTRLVSEAQLVCLLGIPFTSAVINVFTRRLGNTLSLWMLLSVRTDPTFPLAIFRGSEESQKEVGSSTSQSSTLVQDFEPPRDQGMENPTEPCTNNTMSENDRSGVAVLENMEEKNCSDETEVRIETSNNEAGQCHTRKLDEYDPSLDIPIALRKGTRSCTKHPICNYVSYGNLSPQFRAFTASLDSTIIPKNIYTALECPEWKIAVMEEMKALEKNRTWEICALPKGHITVIRSKEGISVSQRKYTLDLLTETGKFTYPILVLIFPLLSKKQSVVVRSSAEAEYKAMSLGICEEIWLQKVLSDLHQECETLLKLFCDNKAAISIANNLVQHDRTKHVEIDRHFIKERLDSGSICIPYIPSSQQVADVLTKGLLRPHFDVCVSKLGLIDIYVPT
ncbi:hypothetical protein E6C27_scaffold207G001230 [Cucumis melo var. makuwa]|uniref:Integrase catalytic domain-containing protein n=1 Tax=Cucumis melo var. makuwa TaxID=1194695 RepID=A0A5A7U962_CUCMM|nr:hypothetical protein E6C27_scaffold207G001230 [Cucumis melo var. makuwa]